MFKKSDHKLGIRHWGLVIKAFVVKRDPSLTENELLQYCRENLTNYKMPRHVEFKKELPKTNVGKILRRALKEEMAGETVAK